MQEAAVHTASIFLRKTSFWQPSLDAVQLPPRSRAPDACLSHLRHPGQHPYAALTHSSTESETREPLCPWEPRLLPGVDRTQTLHKLPGFKLWPRLCVALGMSPDRPCPSPHPYSARVTGGPASCGCEDWMCGHSRSPTTSAPPRRVWLMASVYTWGIEGSQSSSPVSSGETLGLKTPQAKQGLMLPFLDSCHYFEGVTGGRLRSDTSGAAWRLSLIHISEPTRH